MSLDNVQSGKNRAPNKTIRTTNKLLQTPNKFLDLVTLIRVYILEFRGGLPSMCFHLWTRMRQVYYPD